MNGKDTICYAKSYNPTPVNEATPTGTRECLVFAKRPLKCFEFSILLNDINKLDNPSLTGSGNIHIINKFRNFFEGFLCKRLKFNFHEALRFTLRAFRWATMSLATRLLSLPLPCGRFTNSSSSFIRGFSANAES